jgi:hypothetical protein
MIHLQLRNSIGLIAKIVDTFKLLLQEAKLTKEKEFVIVVRLQKKEEEELSTKRKTHVE